MDILFVANWSAPGIVGANYASSGIHAELARRNLNIGVLSSLVGHKITDQSAKSFEIEHKSITELQSNGITYLLPSLPEGWSARHIHNSDWDKAVKWGTKLLNRYKPKVVHLQQWQNFWWMAEAASNCAIPFHYTPYDFGLICARTVLVKSDGSRCEGPVSDKECEVCIYKGRGAIGKLNENLVKVPVMSRFLKVLTRELPALKLHERGIVLDPIQTRLNNDRNRLQSLIANLDTLVVNSNFTKALFSSKGPVRKVKKIDWFQSLNISSKPAKYTTQLSTVGFIGRISPEKGLRVLLESLRIIKNRDGRHLKLIVAGDASNDYAISLQREFADLDIEWIGWIESNLLSEIYDSIDLLVVPSISYDNGPITIMEAIASKTPVIVSNNETLLTYLSDISSDHIFESGSSESLARLINHYAENPQLLNIFINELPEPMTLARYVDQLMSIYESSLAHG